MHVVKQRVTALPKQDQQNLRSFYRQHESEFHLGKAMRASPLLKSLTKALKGVQVKPEDAWVMFGTGLYPVCEHCKGDILQCNVRGTPPKTCSKECAHAQRIERSIETKASHSSAKKRSIQRKRDATNLDRYGDHPMRVDHLKEKLAASCLAKYGTRNPASSSKVKAKIKDTWKSRYGVENPIFATEVREKIRRTCQRKYGVDNYVDSDHFLAQQQAYWERLRSDPDFREKHNANRDARFRATNQKKYGVDYPLQHPGIHSLAMSTGLKSRPMKVNGKIFQVQGFEPVVIRHLIGIGWEVSQPALSIPYEYEGKQKMYIPDLVAISPKGKRYIVEVKSAYTARINWDGDRGRGPRKYMGALTYVKENPEYSGYLFVICSKDEVLHVLKSKREILKYLKEA